MIEPLLRKSCYTEKNGRLRAAIFLRCFEKQIAVSSGCTFIGAPTGA